MQEKQRLKEILLEKAEQLRQKTWNNLPSKGTAIGATAGALLGL